MMHIVTRNTTESEDTSPKYWGKGIHKDDILCMGYQDPDMLITGSYDGDIVVWDIYTQKVIFVADSQCSQTPKKARRMSTEKEGTVSYN